MSVVGGALELKDPGLSRWFEERQWGEREGNWVKHPVQTMKGMHYQEHLLSMNPYH